MAFDAQRKELAGKVAALVAARFGGDYRAAFAHYDADGDGGIGSPEVKVLLSDAGVGNVFTGWAWAAGVIEEMDADKDRKVTWEEFVAAVEGNGPPTG